MSSKYKARVVALLCCGLNVTLQVGDDNSWKFTSVLESCSCICAFVFNFLVFVYFVCVFVFNFFYLCICVKCDIASGGR